MCAALHAQGYARITQVTHSGTFNRTIVCRIAFWTGLCGASWAEEQRGHLDCPLFARLRRDGRPQNCFLPQVAAVKQLHVCFQLRCVGVSVGVHLRSRRYAQQLSLDGRPPSNSRMPCVPQAGPKWVPYVASTMFLFSYIAECSDSAI